MLRENDSRSKARSLEDWFDGKPASILALFNHFVREYKRIGKVKVRSAKTMIVITTQRKGIAYAVPKKSLIDITFPFKQAYPDNLCFHKIAKVPLGPPQFNHHLRLETKEDVNEEVKRFMKMAYELGR
jgi:hypothetical protein